MPELKLAVANTVMVSRLSLPTTELPSALKLLPGLTLRGALTVTGAVKLEVACTVNVWLLVEPMSVLALTVTGALAVIGAVDEKTVLALILRL